MPTSFKPNKEPSPEKSSSFLLDQRQMHFDIEEDRWYQGAPLAQVVARREQAQVHADNTFLLLSGISLTYSMYWFNYSRA